MSNTPNPKLIPLFQPDSYYDKIVELMINPPKKDDGK
jgi:hypothetical protein